MKRVFLVLLLVNPPFFFFLETESLAKYYCALSALFIVIGLLGPRNLRRPEPAMPVLLGIAIALYLLLSTVIATYLENDTHRILFDLATVALPLALLGLLQPLTDKLTVRQVLSALVVTEVLKFGCTYCAYFTPSLGIGVTLATQGTMRYLDLLLPVGLLSAVYLSIKSRNPLYYVAVVVLACASILSMTRGIWLAEFVATVVLVILTARWRPSTRFAVSAVAATVVLVGCIASADTEYDVLRRADYALDQLDAKEGTASARRIDEFKWVLADMSKTGFASYFFGTGPGATYLGVTGYSADDYWSGQRHYIHNQFLSLFFHFGLIGTLLLIVPLWRAVVLARRQESREIVGPYLAAGVVLSMTSPILFALPYCVPYFVVLKLLLQVDDHADSDHRQLQHATPHPGMLAIHRRPGQPNCGGGQRLHGRQSGCVASVGVGSAAQASDLE